MPLNLLTMGDDTYTCMQGTPNNLGDAIGLIANLRALVDKHREGDKKAKEIWHNREERWNTECKKLTKERDDKTILLEEKKTEACVKGEALKLAMKNYWKAIDGVEEEVGASVTGLKKRRGELLWEGIMILAILASFLSTSLTKCIVFCCPCPCFCVQKSAKKSLLP